MAGIQKNIDILVGTPDISRAVKWYGLLNFACPKYIAKIVICKCALISALSLTRFLDPGVSLLGFQVDLKPNLGVKCDQFLRPILAHSHSTLDELLSKIPSTQGPKFADLTSNIDLVVHSLKLSA